MKRVLSLVLALVMVLGMIPTFAAEMTGAEHLKEHGFISGGTNGDLMEANKLTREQLAAVMSQLYGEEDQAAIFAQPADYSDWAKVADWAKPYVAYNEVNGWMQGNADGSFNPQGIVSAQQLAALLLKVLGYDFTWSNALQVAAANGLEISGAELTRGQAFEAIWTAVSEVKIAGEEQTLGVKLGKLTPPAPAVLAVSSVSANNLKQFVVKFNREVDKTEAQKIANYKAYNAGSTTNLAAGGSAALQADNMTVVVTLGGQFNNGTTAKVVIENLVAYTNDAVSVVDVTVPTVVGIAVSGPNTITVEYSEPVTNLNISEYEIDNGNYIITGAVANGSNKVDITVGVNFTEGEHTIKFKGTNVTDYAGYKVIPTSSTFTVVKDTTAPTVTVKSATPTEVKLVFSKPVTNVKDANVAYRHTFNTNIYQLLGTSAAVVQTSSTEVTIDFTTSPIPLGATSFYVSYVSGTGTKIQDLWGNKLEATTLTLNITMDTTKPTVTEVKFIDAATLKVIFSEKVDEVTAETATNYVIKDSADKAVSVVSATRGGANNNEVTLAFAPNALGGGSYSIEIKNVKDDALVKNIMDTYTATLTITDTVKPTVLAGKFVIDNTVANQKVTAYIPFSEVMDTASLVKANFLKNVNGGGLVALSADDKITIAADGKSVTIVIDNAGTDVTTLDVMVGAVKDPAGNGLASFTQLMSGVGFTADSIAVEKVEAIARNQVRVTFNGRLSAVTATGYSFAEYVDPSAAYVNALSVASHTVNSANKSVVVFNLGSNLSYDVTSNGNPIVMVVNNATGTKSFLGTQVSNLAATVPPTAIGAGKVVDKIAPVLTSVNVDSATQITLTFSEELEATTFAATLNGFTVAGPNTTLTTVVLQTATTVRLTGTNFNASTLVSYNAAAGITDIAGNALASFADQGE